MIIIVKLYLYIPLIKLGAVSSSLGGIETNNNTGGSVWNWNLELEVGIVKSATDQLHQWISGRVAIFCSVSV